MSFLFSHGRQLETYSLWFSPQALDLMNRNTSICEMKMLMSQFVVARRIAGIENLLEYKRSFVEAYCKENFLNYYGEHSEWCKLLVTEI